MSKDEQNIVHVNFPQVWRRSVGTESPTTGGEKPPTDKNSTDDSARLIISLSYTGNLKSMRRWIPVMAIGSCIAAILVAIDILWLLVRVVAIAVHYSQTPGG